MIKKLSNLAIAGLLLSACTDTKKQEQDLMSQVIKLHDTVMMKDELAVKNKMALDSLLKTRQAGINKDSVSLMLSNLNNADKAMEDWMHQFNADNDGKPHDVVMKYLNEQKQKLTDVDSMITLAVNQSNTYISTHKK